MLAAALLLAALAPSAHAAVNAPISGEIERISINDPGDHWSGGTLVVGGQNVIVPRNLLLDLPANRLTLQQLFTEASATCIGSGETGLAKADRCNTSGMGAIATIAANRSSSGNVIAGDVFIQKGIETVTGQITYIDYTDGYFRVNGITGDPNTGVMVRLNDPDGRHTVQQGKGCGGGPNCSPDPRFTLDPDNYTNVFSTGYPLCIPSTQPRSFADRLDLDANGNTAETLIAAAGPTGTGDLLCPETNRTVNGGQPVDDSRRFAPIQVGDSISAEGNFEKVAGARFLSAHTTVVSKALTTKSDPTQPDYLFLDEVEIDAPGFQNGRVRTLIIGFATRAPTDVLIWSIHYDPITNSVHEFPLASAIGCDLAAGPGTCSAQGLVGAGANIFKIRHDVDFLVGAKPRLNPCAHLKADPRFGSLNLCPNGGAGADALPTTLGEQFAILSPIPHEIQARTGHALANPGLVTLDIKGNVATNGQYLFPFGMGLGGISVPEFVEINLDAINSPFHFSGIPWNLDRRLSPGGCIDTNGDGIVDCEATPQPLDPFPFEELDPRIQASVPFGPYNDPNFTGSPLGSARDRILSFVDPNIARPNGNGFEAPAPGNFNGDLTRLAWPPATPPAFPILPTPDLSLVCAADTASSNAPPVAVADAASTNAGVPVVISVLANDTDADGNALAVTAVTQPVGGLVAINAGNTSVTFTPAAGFSGTTSFSYTVSDGIASATGTVTATVAVPVAGNTAPVAAGDDATTPEDTAVDIAVLGNDSDPNGDPLSILSVTQPANGNVVINVGSTSLKYTPRLNFNGADSFTYTVSDGLGGTATATVTLTVTAVNDAPVAGNDSTTTTPGSPVTITVLANDTDADGDVLTISGVTQGTNGSVAVVGSSVIYTPAAGFTGTDTFTYTASDGNLGTVIGVVTVTVTGATLDQITVTRAQFRADRNEWRVDGTGSVSGNVVTIHLGPNLSGSIVGSATVGAVGVWTFRTLPGVPLGSNTTISVESTGGGRVLAFPVTVR